MELLVLRNVIEFTLFSFKCHSSLFSKHALSIHLKQLLIPSPMQTPMCSYHLIISTFIMCRYYFYSQLLTKDFEKQINEIIFPLFHN